MNQVEIKVSVNAGDASHVEALSVFLNAIGNNELPKVQAPKGRKPKAEVEKPKPNKEVEAPKTEKKILTKEDVRAVLSKKVGTNRDAIKAKLTELGANNVTSLDESNFEEFINFLNSLE